MDTAQDIREFLTVAPSEDLARRRRAPRLRQQPAGQGAAPRRGRDAGGISVEYYTRLERGNANGVSEDVLEGVVRALQLDEAERAHLFDLVRAASTSRPPRRRPAQERVRLDGAADPRLDVRHRGVRPQRPRSTSSPPTALGHALYADVFDDPVQPPNMARFLFLNPRARSSSSTGSTIAHDAVAILRAEAGRDPHDRRLSDLIGELSTRSDEFRARWAAHNVKFHRTGVKRFHHPIVGDLDPQLRSTRPARRQRPTHAVYTAEPGSAVAATRCKLLASWTRHPTQQRRRAETHADHPQQHRHRQGRRPTGSPATSTSTPSPPRRRRRAHRPTWSTSRPARAPRGTRTRSGRPSSSPRASASASARRADRGHPPRRPRLLRARRGPLARRRAEPLHGPPRHQRGRRPAPRRPLGRARHRRRVRRRAARGRLTNAPARRRTIQGVPMEHRPLGRTGVSVSKLCLGAMMFGAWGNPTTTTRSASSTPRSTPGSTSSTPPTSTRPASPRRSSARRSKAAATTSSSPRRSSCRWATTPNQPARHVAALDHTGGRGLAAAAGHRLDRPLPGPPPDPDTDSTRRSARSATSSTRARSATSATRPSPPR